VPLSEALREHADEGTPLVTAEPDAPASQAIRQAARGIIAQTPVELPVMQAVAADGPAPAAFSGTELPVVQ
jgi:ATP-binding protein involved in chromosome partitioning